MIKIRLGRRRDDSSLRPLSEKEIQKRLYGSFFEETTKTQEPPPVEPAWNEPVRKAQKDEPRVSVTVKKPAAPPRLKPSFKFPWKEIASVLSEVASALMGTARRFLPKISNKWVIGVAIVVALFAGIHVLNIYRANAMKAPKISAAEPMPTAAVSFPEEPLEGVSEPPDSPLEPPTPAAPKVQVKKPYVVQVATYANQRDAERLTDQISGSGFSAFVYTSGRPGGKTFYLVCLGRFETFQEAQAQFKSFKDKSLAKDFPDSFVRVL